MEKKICPVCSVPSGNLVMHMKKHNDPPKNEEANEKPESEQMDPRYASKSDINELKELMMGFAKGPAQPVKMAERVQADSELPDTSPVPPKYRMLVDDILGPEFGVNLVYPDTGSGFLFKVIVPREKSNASQAHLEFYKSDIRTKAIGYQEGIEGVQKFLEKVARNLKIIKQNK